MPRVHFFFQNHSTLLVKLLPEVPVQVHLPLLEFIFSFKNHSTLLLKLLPEVPVQVHLPLLEDVLQGAPGTVLRQQEGIACV